MNMKTGYMKYITYPLGLRPYNQNIKSGKNKKDEVNSKYCVYFNDYDNYSFKDPIFTLIYNI